MKKRFTSWEAPEITDGKPTKYNWLVCHSKNLKLGRRTDIGAFTYINARHGIVIEDEVQIGSHCSIYTVSTIDDKTGPVFLGKNCRIGTHSVVMPGVSVGSDAVVGAFSFVNKNIPPGALAYGIPVKIARRRGDGKAKK